VNLLRYLKYVKYQGTQFNTSKLNCGVIYLHDQFVPSRILCSATRRHLGIPGFCDLMLCLLVSNYHFFEGNIRHHLEMQCHIPEDQTLNYTHVKNSKLAYKTLIVRCIHETPKRDY
jgi:hypothetical protein